VRESIAQQALSSDLQQRFDEAAKGLEQSMKAVRESLARLDSTLTDAASNAEAKMRYQLDQLQARAARAETGRNEVVARHAEALSSALFPNKALQEREIAGVGFVARYGTDLLKNLYDTIHTGCHDHQVIEV